MINTEADNLLFDSILTQALKQKNQIYLNSLPSEGELSRELDYSAEFKKKIQELITSYKRKSILKKTFSYMKKFVAILLIAAGLGFSVLMFNQPVRAAIQNIITQWFDQYTRFDFQSDSGVIEPRNYTLAYLPDGFVESKKLEFPVFERVIYEYEDLNGIDILFEYSVTSESYSISLDNEHSTHSKIELKGSEAHLFESNQEDRRSYLVWVQEGYTFKLASMLDTSELIKIAQNIRIQK